ncbi:hypothetical protein [Dyadobacter sp. CY312]|uniref:hypothetical protein n=1 Tax=Dyadobacter sp. CY312 TaxID=2907303 RepID=UPI001F415DEF|nr:hypothetical protein [Dyadobacter sp. CY312]MCE7043451.1 hypothetical protein [Dyadobacter sp. CY312]
MKTKYLLPNSWRPFGIALTLITVPLTLCILIFGDQFPFVLDSIPTPFRFEIPDWSYSENIFSRSEDGTISLQIIDELLGFGMITGLFIVGFAKLKIEDERIAQIRLESLQWGIYANFIIMALCILFVYGSWFFTVMIYNIFTPLLIFVARFYWLLFINQSIEDKSEKSLV